MGLIHGAVCDGYCGECDFFCGDGRFISGIDLEGETKVIASGVCALSSERVSEDTIACPLKQDPSEEELKTVFHG